MKEKDRKIKVVLPPCFTEGKGLFSILRNSNRDVGYRDYVPEAQFHLLDLEEALPISRNVSLYLVPSSRRVVAEHLARELTREERRIVNRVMGSAGGKIQKAEVDSYSVTDVCRVVEKFIDVRLMTSVPAHSTNGWKDDDFDYE